MPSFFSCASYQKPRASPSTIKDDICSPSLCLATAKLPALTGCQAMRASGPRFKTVIPRDQVSRVLFSYFK